MTADGCKVKKRPSEAGLACNGLAKTSMSSLRLIGYQL
jgi:hypothetical protein